MSDESIGSGQRWRDQLGRQLQSIRTGILCMCPENQAAIAIHFEAGALSRHVDEDSRLIPYCFDLRPADLTWPLSDFQGRTADREGTWKLVTSINSAMTSPVQESRLEVSFGGLWPRLEKKLAALPTEPAQSLPKARTADEMIAEVLDRVRLIERYVAKAREPSLDDQAEVLVKRVEQQLRDYELFREMAAHALAKSPEQRARDAEMLRILASENLTTTPEQQARDAARSTVKKVGSE